MAKCRSCGDIAEISIALKSQKSWYCGMCACFIWSQCNDYIIKNSIDFFDEPHFPDNISIKESNEVVRP